MAKIAEKRKIKVVLVEDDQDDAFLVRDFLNDTRFLDCQLKVIANFEEGLQEILTDSADVYLLDHHLGAGKGVDLIAQAREAGITKPMILLTGNDSPEVDQEAQKAGANDYILKAELNTSILERSIRYALSQWEATHIQEQLLRESLLREEAEYREAQWQLISETIPYGLWVTDTDGRVEYVSYSFLELLGLDLKEIEELNFQDLLVERLREKWQQTLASGKQWNEEMKLTGPDGDEVFVLSRGLPVKDEDGEILQWVGINLDITREKIIDQRKDRFLQIASHELKSPIMSILSSLYILEEEVTAGKIETGTDYIKRMKRQLKNLTQLVEDLLDLSKIEMEKLSYYPEIMNLNEVVNEVIEDLNDTHGHTIKVAMDADLYLRGDKQRIRQVLVNLINNAIKYSPQADQIEVKVKGEGEQVTIEVTDFGIGIPESELGKIFGKFYSGESLSTKDFSGLGLGLFLARKIVELHRGEISVVSQVGKGSTFTVVLPIDNGD